VETRRFTNPSLPTTLHAASVLLYLSSAVAAVAAVFERSFLALFGAALLLCGAYLTANARTIGWLLGLFVASAQLFLPVLYLATHLSEGVDTLLPITLALPALTFAALVHPESRDYQRVWFN